MRRVLLLVLWLAAVGAGQTPRSVTLTQFNAGELSPQMEGRTDFARYYNGARTLENMLVRSQGPVTRRPGTKYIATVKDSDDATRVIACQYSTDDTYVLELGDEYMRFYRAGAQVLDGTAYELATPWDKSDVFELQYTQDAQYMRFVHPDYPPYKLTRNSASHTDWTLSKIDFETGPFLDENDGAITITPSATTGTVTLTASSALFNAEHVGALWEIGHLSPTATLQEAVATDGTPTSSITLTGEFDGTIEGKWTGIVSLKRSVDAGSTWTTVWSIANVYHATPYQQRWTYTADEEEEDVQYRFVMSEYGGLGVAPTGTIVRREAMDYGVVRIATYASTTSVTATVLSDLTDTAATTKWSEGVWSDYRGWPRSVEHHEQRCIYGGSESYPQTVWGSVVSSTDADYDDFTDGDGENADEAWTYVLPGMSPIQWMTSAEYLMIGTTDGVGRLGSTEVAITPTETPIYRQQSRYGCAYMDAIEAGDTLLYVERGAERVREVTYTYAEDRYVAEDLTILAEHIADGGIVQLAFQQRPEPLLWAVRADGQLLALTYERRHEVLAWSRHITGQTDSDTWDEFESVAVVPGGSTRADGTTRLDEEVWVVVKRTVNSSTVRYIEQFQAMDWGTDSDYCWYVDCGGYGTSGGGGGLTQSGDTWEGMTWAVAESCGVYADGRPVGSFTVNGSGVVDVEDEYDVAIVGLTYTSTLQTMPLVDQETQSRASRIKSIAVDFIETMGAHVGASTDKAADWIFSDDDFATSMDPYTGYKPRRGYAPFLRSDSRKPVVTIYETDPVPLTVRSVTVNMEVATE